MTNPPAAPEPHHIPVLPAEVLDALAPAPGEVFVDATVGVGGHARLLAERLGPASRRLARKIVEVRRRTPLETTEQLAELVRRCVPWPKGRRPAIDPATRTFQALRIAVNDELGALDRLLAALPASVKPGGRVAVIS